MIEATDEYCALQSEALRQAPYHVIWAVYVIVSFLALVITIPILRVVYKFVVSSITVALSRLHIAFSILFLVMFLVTSIFHFYNYLTATSPCDYLFYVKDCIWSFPVVTLSLIGIVTSQAGLSVARLLSTVNIGAKLDENRKIGTGLAILVITIRCFRKPKNGEVLVSFIALVLGLIESDPMEPRIMCSLIPTSTARTSNILFYFLLGLDFFTFFLYFVSWYRNKKLTEETYSLTLKFKILENYRGIKIFLPLIVMHFLMFGFYTISTIILRNNYSKLPLTTYNEIGFALFIVPLYVLIQNILLYFILRKLVKNRIRFQKSLNQSAHHQTEAYFRGLYSQWNLPSK